MPPTRLILRSFLMLVPFFALLFSACSSSNTSLDTSGTAEGRYEKALAEYGKGDYEDAIVELEPVMFTSRGSALEDDVLFLLGQSFYKSKQYLLAIDIYTRLLQQVPSSVYIQQTQFQLAKSHEKLSTHFELDHEHTEKAIQQFSLYLNMYASGPDSAQAAGNVSRYRELMATDPANSSYRERYVLAQAEAENADSRQYAERAIGILREKLAKKVYFIAHQYIQLRKYKAAGIYYDEVIRHYSDTSYLEPALRGRINVLIKRKKWFEAGQALDQYLQAYPDRSAQMQDERDKIMKNFTNS